MSSNHDATSTPGLGFVGSMTASISHEIKNVLAIVNENAGLLEDLALLAEKGRPLSPDRLKTMSANIRRQVQRADDIIRRLNRFAHSTHEPAATTDLGEILEFTAALVARLAAMKNVTLSVAMAAPVAVRIRPFVLENLLWICLKNLFAVTQDNRTVVLGAQALDGQIAITLQMGAGLPLTALGAQVASEGQPLLAALRAEVSVDAEQHLMRLTMRPAQDE
jgi:C4-dicarboxylate-specific signal transduction histidine kinase